MAMRKERPEKYLIDDTGLPYPVTVENGVEIEIDEDTGEVVSEAILNYESFIRTLAIVRCAIPNKLSGREVRFLRTVRDIMAKDFARELGIQPETLSRIEHGDQVMGETLDRFTRFLTCQALSESGLTPNVKYDVLRTMALRAQFAEGDGPEITLIHQSGDVAEAWDSDLLEAA